MGWWQQVRRWNDRPDERRDIPLGAVQIGGFTGLGFGVVAFALRAVRRRRSEWRPRRSQPTISTFVTSGGLGASSPGESTSDSPARGGSQCIP